MSPLLENADENRTEDHRECEREAAISWLFTASQHGLFKTNYCAIRGNVPGGVDEKGGGGGGMGVIPKIKERGDDVGESK